MYLKHFQILLLLFKAPNPCPKTRPTPEGYILHFSYMQVGYAIPIYTIFCVLGLRVEQLHWHHVRLLCTCFLMGWWPWYCLSIGAAVTVIKGLSVATRLFSLMMHNHPWLSEIPAPVGSQDVTSHSNNWILPANIYGTLKGLSPYFWSRKTRTLSLTTDPPESQFQIVNTDSVD